MSDLSLDVKAQLAKNAQERAAKNEALQKSLEAQAQPPAPAITDTGTPATPLIEKPSTEAVLPVDGNPPVPVVELKKEEPPITPPVVEEPQKPWDADDTVVTPAVDSKFDAKKLGSALGLEVADESQLIQTVNERLTKAKQLEAEKDTILQGIPESLKEAIDVAKKGGDWRALTGNSVDVKSLDPLDVFDSDYAKRNGHRFKKEDGSIDLDKMHAAIDSIPEELRLFQGDAIKREIAAIQLQQKASILAQAERKQLEFSKKLSEATRDVAKLLPKETFGITLEARHGEHLYNGINNHSLIKKHLGDLSSEVIAGLDPSKLTKAIAVLEYGEKAAKFQYGQGEVAAKKALLNKVTNPQVNTTGLPAAPEVTDAERPKSTTEKLKDMRDRHIKAGSL